MTKSSLMRNVAVVSATALFATLPAVDAYAQQMQLLKLPKQFDTGSGTYSNLEGFVVVIPDYNMITKTVPDLEAFTVNCDAIHTSMPQRATCNSGTTYTCSSLYTPSSFKPAARLNELVPAKPVQSYANFYSVNNPTKKVVAINLGFFDTRPFQNRSANQNEWKPIYQEACALNLGTYKPQNISQYVSNFGDRQVKSDGSLDKPFGTLVFRASGGVTSSLDTNLEVEIASGDLALNGVWLRRAGTNYSNTAASIPAFVQEKADSKVGRTVIGLNGTTRRMKVLVVQGGPGGNTGISIDDARKFFDNTYTHVLLLDGSGSSQLAANFAYSRINNLDTSAGRTNCIFSTVVSCTKRGDSVNSSFVSHWDAKFKLGDATIPGNMLVDRWTPNVLVLMSNN